MKFRGSLHLQQVFIQLSELLGLVIILLTAFKCSRKNTAFAFHSNRWVCKPHYSTSSSFGTSKVALRLSQKNKQMINPLLLFPMRNINDDKQKTVLEDLEAESSSYSSEVPLVFIPGMKGTHLSYYDDEYDDHEQQKRQQKQKQRQRAWLSFGNLINFPPKADNYFPRSLALPLTYHEDGETGELVQDRGHLRPDGIVENIIEYSNDIITGGDDDDYSKKNKLLLKLFPFYGQAVELFMNTKFTKRPNVACYDYDWRRPLEELSLDFEKYLDEKFPGQPVQVVAHSMGGLITFGAMRRNPEKFAPGAVFVGVPFGTGIQYFQDLHRGYFTELNRCRQFLPQAQFTMSSHWSFFPTNKEEAADLFVDVSDNTMNSTFIADKSGIGNPGIEFQPIPVNGTNVEVNFYNVSEWERIECGIFDPTYGLSGNEKDLYKRHMSIQLKKGLRWRREVHSPRKEDEKLPPLVVCQSGNNYLFIVFFITYSYL